MTPMEKVTACRKQLAQRKSDQARAEGERDGLLKRLKDDFGLASLEAAEARAVEMQAELATERYEQDKLMVELDSMMEAV